MLPTLLLAAATTAPAAPLPRDTVPNTTGPAPRVMTVKADASGAVWITANVYSKQKVQQQYFVVENGKQVMKTQEVEQTVSTYVRKTLGDFGGKFATADGLPLTTEETLRRAKVGTTVLVTADGKPIDKGWLKAVSGDTIVMTAEGLGEAHFVHGSAPYPTTAGPRLVMLGTDASGAVRLPVNPNAANGGVPVYYDDFGGRGGRVINRKMIIQNDVDWAEGPSAPASTPSPGADGKKALTDVRFDAYDATGRLMTRTAALERLKAGGLAIVAGDNRFPDADYLKPFRDDLVVLVSNELVFPPGMPNPYDRPNAKPAAPANAPGNAGQPVQLPAVQVAPAVIKRVQIQIEK